MLKAVWPECSSPGIGPMQNSLPSADKGKMWCYNENMYN
jgi:hypothetical protein